MIILNKKRILFICIAMCIAVGVAWYATQDNMIYSLKTTETIATPASNRVIILDAGHGSPDEGAESSSGVTENAINLSITFKLQNLLEQSGATVILTRSDENGIYNVDSNTIRQKKVSDIKNRVEIGNNSSADVFVSIHLNKIPQTQYKGWQTFFKNKNEQSEKLAKCIQESLNQSMQKENKREVLSIKGIYLVNHVTIPITIVECGFLSNKEEEILLQEDEYQNRLAWGIYIGIMDYFE